MTHGEREQKINGPYLSELPNPALEDQAVAGQAGQVRVDQNTTTNLAEAAFDLATGVVSSTLANDHEEEEEEATPHHHDSIVSVWQALWGIFVILLFFTTLAGCYIYLAKQGMKGGLDLNWDSLENEPKNQLRIGGSKSRRRKPSHHDIDMPSFRKNSMEPEPRHPGADIASETIQDLESQQSTSDGLGNKRYSFQKIDSCALINLEDL